MEKYATRIKQCWKQYERRNKELAHLASNLLILLATLYDCRLICGENLTTLKTMGRGRGVRGRFRNWRNNSQVRGELWRVLTYKCYLAAIRTRTMNAFGTTHTCPHCHQLARTFASPSQTDRKKAQDWGPWLCCENPACLWNGARDYAASQHCRARHGLSHHLLRDRHLHRVSHDFFGGQASFVQRGWRGTTVDAAGDHTPPERGQTRLLCRLVKNLTFMHFTSQSNAFCAFNLSTQEARAQQCMMFGELRVFSTVCLTIYVVDQNTLFGITKNI